MWEAIGGDGAGSVSGRHSPACSPRVDRAFAVGVVVPARVTPHALAGQLIRSLRDQGAQVTILSGASLIDVEHGCYELDAVVGFSANADPVRRAAAGRGVPCAVAEEPDFEGLMSSLQQARRERLVMTSRVADWPLPAVALECLGVRALRGVLEVTASGVVRRVIDGSVTALLCDPRNRTAAVELLVLDRYDHRVLHAVVAVDESVKIRVSGSATFTIDDVLKRAPDDAMIELGPHGTWLLEAHPASR